MCFAIDVIKAAEIMETTIISTSRNSADGLRFLKNFRALLDTKKYEIRKTAVLNKIIKKSFIVFVIETPAALFRSHDSVSMIFRSPVLKILSAKRWC